MRISDRFDYQLARWLEATGKRDCPVSMCLRLAYLVDMHFRYEPAGDYDFNLIFSDGSSVTLQD
jgi:hypothetical protein